MLAGAVVAGAWRTGHLGRSGAAAALLVGTTILHGAGYAGGLALLLFFVGSSAVGHLAPDPARHLGARGGRRDAWQVLANGGAAAVAALLFPGPLALWMVTGSLAAAAADTWASGLGALSAREPRHILRWRTVPAGTSGGITTLGTVGGLIGALTVALPLGVLTRAAPPAVAATGIGFGGMLLDSLLGAGLQGKFACRRCGSNTERRRHACGDPTERTGGLAWLTNDGVNAIVTAAAAAVSWWAWPW